MPPIYVALAFGVCGRLCFVVFDVKGEMMADCELLALCPYFNESLKGLEAVQEVLKKKYCRCDYTHCARYIVFKALGRENVPSTLVPNQIERARQIIAQHKEPAQEDVEPETK